MSAENDCPSCPECGLPCGTRAGGFTAVAIAHAMGPDHLSCAACGHVWRADAAALEQAAWADTAWRGSAEPSDTTERDERLRAEGRATWCPDHHPTLIADAAAAERAEIVAMLREDARKRARMGALATQAHEGTSIPEAKPHLLTVAAEHNGAMHALDDLADRIAARGPAPVWTDALARKLAEAILRDERTDEHALFCPAHDLSYHPGDCVAGCMAQRVDNALARVRKGAT